MKNEIFEYNFKTSFFDIFVSIPACCPWGNGSEFGVAVGWVGRAAGGSPTSLLLLA